MEKKDLLKKQELAEELGMKFDEAAELFSEETLETMKLQNVNGGAEGILDVLICGANVLCPEVNACNENCSCAPTTPPMPPKFIGDDCASDTTFPPPPTVAQDAICHTPTTPTKP